MTPTLPFYLIIIISFVPRSGKLLPMYYDVLVSCQKIFIYSKVRYRLVSWMFDVGCCWFPVVGCGCWCSIGLVLTVTVEF